MKPEEIAAYIGAAAWIPVVIAWINRVLTKPKLRIIADQQFELGFTSLGPIFNVRLAWFVESRALVVNEVKFEVTHTDGESHTFVWSGIAERFSEIHDLTSGKRQIVSRDQTPIAIKVFVQAPFEKSFRFIEAKFVEADKVTGEPLLDHFNFLKTQYPQTYVADALASQQFHNFINARQTFLWWKPGTYTVKMKISSPQSFKFKVDTFSFSLSAGDVTRLKQNINWIDVDMKNTINSNTAGAVPTEFLWQWVNPSVTRA